MQRSSSNIPFKFSKNVHHLTSFNKIKYNASSGKEVERFHVVLGLIGFELWHMAPLNLYWENIYSYIMLLVSKLAMPQESLASIHEETLKNLSSETMRPTACSPIYKYCKHCLFG